jgi:hypothetical protein
MGSSESKETVEEEEEGRVFEPYLIQWDQHGHLRYGTQLSSPAPLLLLPNYRLSSTQARLTKLIRGVRWSK